jgi:hypothetical protein
VLTVPADRTHRLQAGASRSADGELVDADQVAGQIASAPMSNQSSRATSHTPVHRRRYRMTQAQIFNLAGVYVHPHEVLLPY